MAAAVDFEEQGGGGSELVRLSVGGTPFTSTRATLARCGFLDALLGWPKLPRDEAGRIFVDRDPDLFHFVLSYCRGSLRRTTLDRLDLATRADLIAEAEFYQAGDLAERVVLPPAGATVRYSYRSRSSDYSSQTLHVLCVGRVLEYAADSRTWRVAVEREGVIQQAGAIPIAKKLGDVRVDEFSWPARDFECAAHFVGMPWQSQYTSHGRRLAPFGPYDCGWQWLSSFGTWVDDRAVPRDAKEADPFFDRGLPPLPLDEPSPEEIEAIRAAQSPPQPIRFFPAGAGVGGI